MGPRDRSGRDDRAGRCESNSISDLLGAVDYAVTLGAKQISMSWGANEFSQQASYDSHFNKSGVTFLASSGDDGAGVIWPAVSPYVVSVGGTTLGLDAAGNIVSETAWSGSGGGVSKYSARPSFQTGWQGTAKRAVPDVSYNADPNTGFPVYITNYNGASGWITVGGTSAGSPQWAGLVALINASRASSLNGPNTMLYALAAADYAGNYRDITVGNNGAYTATASYDFVDRPRHSREQKFGSCSRDCALSGFDALENKPARDLRRAYFFCLSDGGDRRSKRQPERNKGQDSLP